MVRTALFLLAILCSSLAHGQESPPVAVEIFPEAPTSATPVTVIVTRSGCPTDFVSRTGNVILIRQHDTCVLPIGNVDEHPVGLLPPGTYTVNVEYFDDEGMEVFTTTFVVAAATPAEVPAFNAYGAIALGVMLAALAMRRVVA